MKINEQDIKTIVPYERNNRVHSAEQITLIARSIKEFGFNQPIVVDEDNVILVGHGRLFAAQELGLKKVPVLQRAGLTEADKKAYRILDNKLQNDSTWDFDSIKFEIEFLEGQGVDVESWGLDELIQTEDIQAQEDNWEGAVPAKSYINYGDIIELNEHKIACGDARLCVIANDLDMVITDPPYGVSYVGKTKEALTIEADNLEEPQLSELWGGVLDNMLPHLKNGGVIYATVPSGPFRSVFSESLKSRGILRQELIWLKDSMVMGHSDYHYKHEPILYGWKPGAAHYITPDRSKTSVLEHVRPKRSAEHPTMKPVTLWGELISNSSRKGETVFDPFLGSGTTLIACDQLGRRCLGVEIDPKYCQVIIERYQQYCLDNNKEFICEINGIPMTSAIKTTNGTETASANA